MASSRACGIRFPAHLADAVGAEVKPAERFFDFVEGVLFFREEIEGEVAVIGVAAGVGLMHSKGRGFAALGTERKVSRATPSMASSMVSRSSMSFCRCFLCHPVISTLPPGTPLNSTSLDRVATADLAGVWLFDERVVWPGGLAFGAGFALAALPLDRAGGLAANTSLPGLKFWPSGCRFSGVWRICLATLWGMGKSGPENDDN